jgi:hypothetical protein
MKDNLLFIICFISITSIFAQDTLTHTPGEIKTFPHFKFSGLLQPRYEHSLTEGVNPAGAVITDDLKSNFRIRRTFLRWDIGVAPKFSATVRLAVNEFDQPIGKVLNYAYLTYNHSHWLNLSIGQQKMLISGEELWSSGRLMMIDRGMTNSLLSRSNLLGTDIGLSVFSKNPGSKSKTFNYAVGVFNGNGPNVRMDALPGKNFTGRLTYYPVKNLLIGFNGLYGYLRDDNPYLYGFDIMYDALLSKKFGIQLFTEHIGGTSVEKFLRYSQWVPNSTRPLSHFEVRGYQSAAKFRYHLPDQKLHSVELGGRTELVVFNEPVRPFPQFPDNVAIHTTRGIIYTPHFGVNLKERDIINLRVNYIITTSTDTKILIPYNLLVFQLQATF